MPKSIYFLVLLFGLWASLPANSYELEGPYNISIDFEKYGLNPDIGVQKASNWKADPLGANFWGQSFKWICIYGHEAEQARVDLQAKIDALPDTAHKPEIVGAFDPAEVNPAPPPNKPEGYKYDIQQCYRALPNNMEPQLVAITEGLYTGLAAEGFRPANAERRGTITVCGIDDERPFFDRRGSQGTTWRINGPDHFELCHIKTANTKISSQAMNFVARGFVTSDFRNDSIVIDDLRQDRYDARKLDAHWTAFGKRLMLVYDWESWGVGQGNAYHALYAQCENDCLVVIANSLTCGPRDSHAIKAPAHNVAVMNTIATWVCTRTETALSSRQFSTKVVDLRNSGGSLIYGSYIEGATGKYNNSLWITADPVYYPGRNVVKVMNDPFGWDDPRWHDPQTWLDWSGKGCDLSRLDDHCSHHVIANSVIYRADLSAIAGDRVQNNPVYAIAAESMLPKRALAKFSPLDVYYDYSAVADVWFDTGRYWRYNLQFDGLPYSGIFWGKTKEGQAVDEAGNHIPTPEIITDREQYELPDLTGLNPMWLVLIEEYGGGFEEVPPPPVDPPPVDPPPVGNDGLIDVERTCSRVGSDNTGEVCIKITAPENVDVKTIRIDHN